MRKVFLFLFVCLLLQNMVLATAYNDYQEIQAREALRAKYNRCILEAESYLSGVRIVTGVSQCYQLGAAKCKEVEQTYKSMRQKCEAQYGKYK